MERLRERSGTESERKSNPNLNHDREELNVKERKIELFKEKIKSLQNHLREKEKYVCDLETKVKERFYESSRIVVVLIMQVLLLTSDKTKTKGESRGENSRREKLCRVKHGD